MTLSDIVYKNMRENLSKYVMYYLSNVIIIMIFFMFGNFLYNLEVGNIQELKNMDKVIKIIVYFCEITIVVFTLIFSSYSISNFLKTRKKEFALLKTLGFTNSHITLYTSIENLLFSLVSIGTGTIVGIMFSRLFFMIITVILDLDEVIKFHISKRVTLLTLIGFVILSQLINHISSYRIKKSSAIELLKEEQETRYETKFSTWKAVLCLLFLVLGYVLALFSGRSIEVTMIPILVVTIAGTYLFYSQFSIFFADKLKKNKENYYKGINLVSLSQLIYKIKDNVIILFTVSVFSAISLTAIISVYSLQKSVLSSIRLNFPQDFNFIERPGEYNDKLVSDTLISKGYEIEDKARIVLIKAENLDATEAKKGNLNTINNKRDFYLMSNSDYNKLATQQGIEPVNLKNYEIIIHTYNVIGRVGSQYFIDERENINLSTDKLTMELNIREEISGGIINDDYENTNTAILADKLYNRVLNDTDESNKIIYYGYNLKSLDKDFNSMSEIGHLFDNDIGKSFIERVQRYNPLIKTMSLLLFIGSFISIIFFMSTNSILYFKIFNEVQKDRYEFIALKKMGMTNEEIKKTIGVQISIMFLIPFIVSTSHAFFAIKALSNLINDNLSIYFIVTTLIFLLLQLVYYNFAKTMYIKQIRVWKG